MRTPLIIAIVLVLAAVAAIGLRTASRAAEPAAKAIAPDSASGGVSAMVNVRLFGPDGKLLPPAASSKVVRSDAEWKKALPATQYEVTRRAGTERAGTGSLLNNHETGVYVCADCGLPLYTSDAKFESGTGWPSFFRPIARENIEDRSDNTLFMQRTETLCPRCGAHLGHVFDDGPEPTGLRYCMNSVALRFVPESQLASLAEAPAKPGETAVTAAVATPTTDKAQTPTSASLALAVFAGGCFWCTEAVFEQLDGVKDVVSGYSGGEAATANYEAVCTGTTGHAEAIRIVYDPAKVSYEQLLKVFFATHDPTTLNRQGNDVGTQYRSAIFYADDRQKKAAGDTIAGLTAEKKFPRPIVTTLEPLMGFHPAETYHQDFACKNPRQGYVEAVAMPKIEKTRHLFADMLKPEAQLKP